MYTHAFGPIPFTARLFAVALNPSLRPIVSSVAIQTATMLPAFLTGSLTEQLREHAGISETGIGVAVAVFFLVAALASPHAGALTDRLGPTRSLRIASTLSMVGLLGLAAFTTSYLVLWAFLAFSGLGLAVAGPGTKVMVARGVPVHRHGMAFGIQAAAVPLAVFVGGLLVPAVAIPFSFRWAYFVAALIPLLGMLAAPNFAPVAKAAATARKLGNIDYRPLIMLAIAAALGSAAATTLASFFVPAATEAGISERNAGFLLAIASGVVIVARILAGLVADRRTTDHLVTVAFQLVLSTVGYVLAATGSRLLLPIGAAWALAFGWSWSGVMVHAVVRHYPQAPGAATGMTSGGLNIGGVVGPAAFGVLVERMSYSWGFTLTAMCALAAAGAATIARRWLAESASGPVLNELTTRQASA